MCSDMCNIYIYICCLFYFQPLLPLIEPTMCLRHVETTTNYIDVFPRGEPSCKQFACLACWAARKHGIFEGHRWFACALREVFLAVEYLNYCGLWVKIELIMPITLSRAILFRY